MGCAALSQNCRFNLTEVGTRFGVQTAIQGINQSPVSGLLPCAYTPESATQDYFQAILLYDYLGTLQIENPTGTGRATEISSPIVPLPAQSHMIGTQAYNRAWMGFSNLLTPTAFPAAYDLSTKNLYPYGMKPVGFGWYAGALVLAGECCTSSELRSGVTVAVGNGHLYICTVAGATGPIQPVWPLTEDGTVVEVLSADQVAKGLTPATWKEQTPVMANRIAVPASPTLAQAGGGTWTAGNDVYVAFTLLNNQGETTPSIPVFLNPSGAGSTVNVQIPALASLAGWMQTLPVNYIPNRANVYVAVVAHGSPAPQLSIYEKNNATPIALGSVYGVTTLVAGAYSPTINTARITGGLLPTPDVEPIVTRSTGAGAFAAGRDVYILQTYVNSVGETLPGPANSIIDTLSNDAVVIDTLFLQGYSMTGINLYECDVPHGTTFDGSDFPPYGNFALFGTFGTGAVVTITNTVIGPPPPTVNTTGTAGNIAQDTLQGGPNRTQGYRWMTVAYQDQFDTISGFTKASAIKYIVDQNGWELSLFNLPTGPSYIKNVICNFTVADGVSAGPYAYSPETLVSDGIQITTTVFPNGTSIGTVNFTDEYLTGLIASTATNTTDRLRVIQPQQCVDLYFSEATRRLFQTGVPGFYSGHWVSLSDDPETYYGDTSNIQVGSDDGERAWCVREYQGVPYSLRERSGFELSPTTADPATWTVTKRWTKVGPCGPRAVDVCGQFMIFIHSSGIYKYEESAPMLVSKELNRFWTTINWRAQQTIWCSIDVEYHEIHIGLPVGNSTIPNVVLVLNYEEGWNNPLAFSRVSQKEITIEGCRKYSVWTNITAYYGVRAYRTVTGLPTPDEGPVDTSEEISRQFISQFLYASSAPDGTVQALTPGVYNDNTSGIDCQYETISAQQMMVQCKLNGINMNVRGNGSLFVSFIAGARRITDWQADTPQPSWLVKMSPMQLQLNPTKGISRNTPSKLNERWRIRYTNGCIADAWFSMKYTCLFISPMFQGGTSIGSK